jgi:hypothetical protein
MIKKSYPSYHAQKLFSKQLPDVGHHLEMEKKIKELELKPLIKSVSIKPLSVKPLSVKPVQTVTKLIVEGSKPVQIKNPILGGKAAKKPETKSQAKGTLKDRAVKIKEIMKSKGLSMTESSKYIKENNISY